MAAEDYPRIPLLEHAEWLADGAGLEKPEGLRWGLKAVGPDLRSYGGFRWPYPGNWVEASDVDESNEGPCPSREGDGLCIALTWRGMARGGIPAHTLLLVGYRAEDILGSDPEKLRVRRSFVRDVIDGGRLLGEHGRNANLQGAHLKSMDLRGAMLDGADLSRAYLDGTDLGQALLLGANLCETYLLHANLRGASLSGVKHDWNTMWPVGFTVPKAS